MSTYRYRAELRNVQHGYTLHQLPVNVKGDSDEAAREAATASLPRAEYPNLWVLTLAEIDTSATVEEEPESGSPATTEVTTG